jgi:5-methylcytosine-specific restriction enzyme subunit McrC
VKIPIRNVYWLLLYAWDHLGAGEEASLAAEEPRHLHDLFASALADTVSRLRARGLDRGYVEVEETLAGVRGRMDLGTTLKRGLLASVRTHCIVDELRHDVLHNRILKATLRSLLPLELDEEVRARVGRQVRALNTVADVRISRRDFGRVQLHRNNRVYDFALRLCRLIHDNLIVDPATGDACFRDFRSDERRMGALFEAFIYRFYRREQQQFRVSRPHVAWYDACGSEQALSLLPQMRTDVVLRSPERRIIVETKFYANPLAGRFGGKKLRSAHLYQLLAYSTGPRYEGMLLYPVVNESLALDYRLNGHWLMVRTINLDQPWVGIRGDLLRLFSPIQ